MATCHFSSVGDPNGRKNAARGNNKEGPLRERERERADHENDDDDDYFFGLPTYDIT